MVFSPALCRLSRCGPAAADFLGERKDAVRAAGSRSPAEVVVEVVADLDIPIDTDTVAVEVVEVVVALDIPIDADTVGVEVVEGVVASAIRVDADTV